MVQIIDDEQFFNVYEFTLSKALGCWLVVSRKKDIRQKNYQYL